MKPESGLRRACFGALLAFAPLLASAAQTDRVVVDAAFDAVVQRYRLPGLALGIVEDGQVVYTRTTGERIAGSGEAIDRQTLFKVASNTKSMTTATLARLVDAGKLRWDDPVTKWLPQFRMNDAWVGREMQVRDLLIHNSGLRAGAGDLMLWPEPNTFTRTDIIHGLAYLKPQRSFRSGYDYDNLLYIVAGEVAAAAGGAPYESLVRREVFVPLGMSRCQVGQWNRAQVGNVAQPHMRQGERNVPVRSDGDIVPATTMDPAGGVRCSLDDMLHWVTAWLKPSPATVQWLSKEQREAVWAPQMQMPLSKRMREWDNSHFSAYGYGWRLADVDGAFKVAHTGTLMGMYSAVTMLPDKGVGFVILINGEGEDARTVLSQVLVKHYTRPAARLDAAHYASELAREDAARPAAQKAPDTSARRKATAKEFASRFGVYRDPWFGEARLCADGNVVRFRSIKSPVLTGVVQKVGAGWLVDWDDASVDAEAWLDFAPQADGTQLRMSKVDPQADFSYDYEDLAFQRVGECARP
ncbi:serine hydrolase domain-containing protein [Lysobacter panacisoli]|uniref:Serine hydrolase n=1 Tax=Lysobacter panacisoli TaxID=1255263 RepID=A0ABP9LQQ0_9GAMM|nr:serine hydrolase domain-containing protein [Lysobacter panacisoli]